MSGYKPCSVFGCTDKYSPRHVFPNPDKYRELFNVWVKACNNVKLIGVEPMRLHKNYRVCHTHFTPDDVSTNNFLKKGISFPSVNLRPSTSRQGVLEITQDSHEPSCFGDKTVMPIASTSKIFNRKDENPGSSGDVKTPHYLLKDVGVTRKEQLSPKARKLYTCAACLQKTSRQLKKRKQKTLKGSELLAKELECLPCVVKNFVYSQIRLGGKHVKGRRYNLDDKILGLILHKQSGRTYRTLSKLFALPSTKTLSSLLGRIPIKCGINDAIFDNLRSSITQLSEKDRKCVLLFDEISIEPHIDVNSQYKEFNGFVNSGLHQTDVIADHALVFMVRGLASSWRQPLMYTFCKGATKANIIKAHIKNIIKECQRVGLSVVASVSDQGQPNVSAINSLVAECNNERYGSYLKKYSINDQSIILYMIRLTY